MEYLNGPSLRDELATHGPMTPAEVRRIIEPICAALQLAHDRQIVHRDLKPANIVSHRFDSGDVVYKVIDFGLANMRDGADTRLTGGDQFIGHGGLLVAGAAAGPGPRRAHDIYSLGVVVFEMLTGRPPFEAATPLGVITKHLCDPPPNSATSCPTVPAGLAQTVGKALAKDPADRWPSMLDFARAIASLDEDGSHGTRALRSARQVRNRPGRRGRPARLAGAPRPAPGARRPDGHPGAPAEPAAGLGRRPRAVPERGARAPGVPSVGDPGSRLRRGARHALSRDRLHRRAEPAARCSITTRRCEWSRVQALGTQLIDATVAVQRKGGLVCGLNPGIIRMTTDEDGERLMVSTGGIGQVQELLASMSETALRGGELHATEMPYIAPEVLTGEAGRPTVGCLHARRAALRDGHRDPAVRRAHAARTPRRHAGRQRPGTRGTCRRACRRQGPHACCAASRRTRRRVWARRPTSASCGGPADAACGPFGRGARLDFPSGSAA